jgi:hypothetical protein
MSTTAITVDRVMSWRPCDGYPRARVEALSAGRPSLTPVEIAALPLPIKHRFWAIIRCMSPRDQRLFACDCAERALIIEQAAGHPIDSRSWAAVEVARRYARGDATEEERSAACSAAGRVAQLTVDPYSGLVAAWTAAYAAMETNRETAWAVFEISTAAEREWQLAHALAYLAPHPPAQGEEAA